MKKEAVLSQPLKYTIAIALTAIICISASFAVFSYSPVGPTPTEKEKEIKAGFVYVGPVGDYGWSYAHDRGRRIVDEKYDWLDTFYAESVPEGEVGGQIDTMFGKGADVVFTTSFSHMIPTVRRADKWSDKMLYHCSGGETPYETITGEEFKADNVGFYMADFYQIYYMNGLMAGALAESDKLGYVAAHTTSEVVRHMNAFMLGAKEVNPDVTMKVIKTGSWYAPGTSTSVTNQLIDWGADAIAYTQDSPAVVRTAQSHFNETGERVYSFSHYTPMKSKGPNVTLSGQLVHWENLYEDLLLKARAGGMENTQHWRLLHSGAVEMGASWGEPINPKFKDELRAVTVNDPVLGNVSVYNLTMTRLEQFKEQRVTYHPFTGPTYDTDGVLRLQKGEVMSQEDLRWHANEWYVQGIQPP